MKLMLHVPIISYLFFPYLFWLGFLTYLICPYIIFILGTWYQNRFVHQCQRQKTKGKFILENVFGCYSGLNLTRTIIIQNEYILLLIYFPFQNTSIILFIMYMTLLQISMKVPYLWRLVSFNLQTPSNAMDPPSFSL